MRGGPCFVGTVPVRRLASARARGARVQPAATTSELSREEKAGVAPTSTRLLLHSSWDQTAPSFLLFPRPVKSICAVNHHEPSASPPRADLPGSLDQLLGLLGLLTKGGQPRLKGGEAPFDLETMAVGLAAQLPPLFRNERW